MNFEVTHVAPTPSEYFVLRLKSGMNARELAAAEIGLKNSLFAISIRNDGTLIGMGRLVGDGGCHVQVVDIAVDPDFQGQKLGSLIMKEIMAYVKSSLPPSCLVNLFADVSFLYEKYGFAPPKKSQGMFLDRSKI